MNPADQKYSAIAQDKRTAIQGAKKPFFIAPFRTGIKANLKDQFSGSLVVILILMIFSGTIWAIAHLISWMIK